MYAQDAFHVKLYDYDSTIKETPGTDQLGKIYHVEDFAGKATSGDAKVRLVMLEQSSRSQSARIRILLPDPNLQHFRLETDPDMIRPITVDYLFI